MGASVKSILGMAFLVATITYLLYTLSETQPCGRVYRAAAPVRLIMQALRSGVENWAEPNQRSDILIWSFKADLATQDFLAHQFYGDALVCGKRAK